MVNTVSAPKIYTLIDEEANIERSSYLIKRAYIDGERNGVLISTKAAESLCLLAYEAAACNLTACIDDLNLETRVCFSPAWCKKHGTADIIAVEYVLSRRIMAIANYVIYHV